MCNLSLKEVSRSITAGHGHKYGSWYNFQQRYADYLVGYISLGDQALLRSGFTFQVMIYSDLPPTEKVDSKTLSRLLSCGDS